MEKAKDNNSKRLIGLDVFRVLAAFGVFLFHSQMHVGCSYGILNEFVSMGAVFMTGFFMLSGYALYLVYNRKNLSDIGDIKKFYWKRLVGIIPVYYVVAILYILLLGKESLKQNILLAPIEMLGLQSTFSGLFPFSHNGGTWFISCLLICYFIYPYLQLIINQINNKIRVLIIFVFSFLILWAPLVVVKFETQSIYTNPFFRFLEFSMGALLCSIRDDIKKSKIDVVISNWLVAVLEIVLLIAGVTIAVKRNMWIGDYMRYNWIVFPIFIFMIITFSGVKSDFLSKSLVLKYLSSISYVFFLAQFFTWKLVEKSMNLMDTTNNLAKVVFAFVICFVISVLLHEIVEKPISKVLKRI